jgi:hypothetical protein
MTDQARQRHPLSGEPLARWWVETTSGWLLLWARDEQTARRRVEAKGREVVRVTPAGSGEPHPEG